MNVRDLIRVYFIYSTDLQGRTIFIYNISSYYSEQPAQPIANLCEQNKICFFPQFKFLVTPVNFKGIIKVADSLNGLFVHTSIMWPVGKYAPSGYL